MVTVYNSLADYYPLNEELIIDIYILFLYMIVNSGLMFEFCRIILKVKLKNFNFERDSNFSREELIFYYIIVPVYCFHLIATLTSLYYSVKLCELFFKKFYLTNAGSTSWMFLFLLLYFGWGRFKKWKNLFWNYDLFVQMCPRVYYANNLCLCIELSSFRRNSQTFWMGGIFFIWINKRVCSPVFT